MIPIISIIVPVYNVEDYLDRCIRSICNQTFVSFELILVDDGSTDQSGRICDKWGDKERRINVIHKENGGASSARNAGLAVARGKYVAFVDSDDCIHSEMYQRLYEMVEEYQADISMCCAQAFDDKIPKRTRTKKSVSIDIWDRKDLLNNFFRVNGERDTRSVCTKLIRRDLMKTYKFIEGRMNEDVETCYYLAVHADKAVVTNERLYYYFVNKNGVTHSAFTEKKMDLLAMWDIVKADVNLSAPEYLYACEMNVKRARFTLLSQMLLNGYNHNDQKLVRIKRNLKHQLRKDYFYLIRWKMPISKKILLTVVCI